MYINTSFIEWEEGITFCKNSGVTLEDKPAQMRITLELTGFILFGSAKPSNCAHGGPSVPVVGGEPTKDKRKQKTERDTR